jgi:F1F0 ATPase subunit 2
MSSFAGVVLSAVTGLFLGALFFGGLWWTISESQSSKNPAFLFTASLLLRVALSGSACFHAFLDLF